MDEEKSHWHMLACGPVKHDFLYAYGNNSNYLAKEQKDKDK